jgi:hypothetical protein
MQSTTTMLREEARTVPLGTAPDDLATTLDALAGYEQVALTSVATMMGDARVASLRTCIGATQDAADIAGAARHVLARNTPAASAVWRSVLGTAVHALDRAAHCGAQNLEIRSCRLQAEAAAETAHRCRQLRARLT